ncbi:hypothetical protein DFH06DRAFT_1215302 [Mycena polygramma]|nr:hypothetical protein DFH06DRAFT_1215302 [Mycena polygramma]
MASSARPQAITLNFPNLVRIAGETIAGTVDLNVGLAQEHHIEHVRINVRGLIKTRVVKDGGQTMHAHEQTVVLVYSKSSLWTRGTAFPAPGSHVLSLPFQFHLPANIPASFHSDILSTCRGTIGYSLEVVGAKSSLFRSWHRIERVFSVLPAANRSQMLAKESLSLQGWVGPWRNTTQTDQLRHGIWGEYSRASVALSIPDMRSFPVATPVPYTLHVVTETKRMTQAECPENRHGKPLFPAPPTKASRLTLRLLRKTTIRAEKETGHAEDSFHLQGTPVPGDAKPAAPPHHVELTVDDPVWIPKDEDDKKARGIWRRAVHFNSTLAFPFAPTSNTETIDWAYTLQVVVPFPGIGNDVKLEVPIHLGPGSACPPPPVGAAGTSSFSYADVLPAGPPPMLDSPPSYRVGDDHDSDEKS